MSRNGAKSAGIGKLLLVGRTVKPYRLAIERSHLSTVLSELSCTQTPLISLKVNRVSI